MNTADLVDATSKRSNHCNHLNVQDVLPIISKCVHIILAVFSNQIQWNDENKLLYHSVGEKQFVDDFNLPFYQRCLHVARNCSNNSVHERLSNFTKNYSSKLPNSLRFVFALARNKKTRNKKLMTTEQTIRHSASILLDCHSENRKHTIRLIIMTGYAIHRFAAIESSGGSTPNRPRDRPDEQLKW